MVDFKTYLCCWKDLLFAKACCIYNIIFAPCTLTLWACRIYLCECLWVYFNRGFNKVCCLFCRMYDWHYYFTDSAFGPNETTLGKLEGDSANSEDNGSVKKDNIIWVRANKFPLSGKMQMQLFGDEINASDICQGALGNCWLLAAMACLAEHPGAINAVFLSKERNPRGKYTLRLFDGVEEKWQRIVIDDYIPCNKSRYENEDVCKPVFSQPNGNELWAILLEKAFAKFCGSYAATEGGHTIWAIRAMTGDPARLYTREGSGWRRTDLVNKADPANKRACAFMVKGEVIEDETMFEVLLKYHKLRSILSASSSDGKDGLHTGHAYSIIAVSKVNTGFMGMGGDTFRMVKIRNPWGCGEWKGDWSDKSPLWDSHPAVKKACKFEDADDGAFWMSWEDYTKHWKKIGVVDRTVDITTLKLHIRDDTHLAPAMGCCKGCCYFWCCCQGPKRLYFPHRSSDETVKVKKSFCPIL